MELVDRYLHAVRGFLPKRDQDDIIRELGEDIRSQLDERQAELGRPPRDVEIEAFLKHLGHPMLLAARFAPQRHLIGAAVFPFYWLTLKIALAIGLIVHLVIAAVLLASGRSGPEVVSLLMRFPTAGAVSVFGWVTLVFAVGELVLNRAGVFEGWQPRTLPQVRLGGPRTSRLHALFELVGAALMVGYVLAIPRYAGLVVGPIAPMVDFAPVWTHYYVPLLLLAIGWAAPPVTALVRPDQPRLRLYLRIAIHLATLMLLGALLDAGTWFVLKSGVTDTGRLIEVLNQSARVGIVVGGVITGIELVRDLWRLRR
jgi:hypothetical protein